MTRRSPFGSPVLAKTSERILRHQQDVETARQALARGAVVTPFGQVAHLSIGGQRTVTLPIAAVDEAVAQAKEVARHIGTGAPRVGDEA